MAIKKPTIVIFDMDGTAVRHINPRLLHILETLDNIGYRISKFFTWLFRRGGKGRIIPLWHKNRKQPRLLVHRAMHKIRRKPVEQIVQPCPGLFTLLELFEQHQIPMALVSNGLGKGYGHDILEKFELNKHFPVTVFREDITKSKPSPEPILTALQWLNLELNENDVVWYIGDRRKDVIAALAAKEHLPCAVVPIAFGIHAAVAIIEKNIGAEHIYMSFYEMYDDLKPMLDDNPPPPRLHIGKPSDERIENNATPERSTRRAASA